MTWSWRIRLLLAYACVGLIAFWPVMHAGFIGDDWEFLEMVSRAPGWTIAFAPLQGRFTRPLVVLTYFVNYQLFGLSSFPYHLTMVLVHVVNAWLVALVAGRLAGGPDARLVCQGSGLVFLLFAGHSEAVSWVAGAADPWLLLVLLTGLLLLGHGLESDRARWAILAGAAVLAAGPLAKESGILAPALVLALGVAALVDGRGRRPIATRTLAVAAALAIVGGLYLLFRASRFGSIFAGYGVLDAGRALLFLETRAFLLRSFFPASRTLAGLWSQNYDIALIGSGAVLLTFLAWRHRAARGGLLFLIACLLLTVAPVLPLGVSVSNTVSERYVYVPSAFAAILSVWAAFLVFSRVRPIAAALVIAFAGLNWWGLSQANRTWIEAGDFLRALMTDLVDTIRAHPPPAHVFVLNAPDNLRGAYIIRNAFVAGLRLLAPDIRRPEERATLVTSHDARDIDDETRLEPRGDRRFFLRLSQGSFLQAEARDTPHYDFEAWGRQEFVLVFKPPKMPAVVTYTTHGRLRVATVIDGLPFGVVEIPHEGDACTGGQVRFSGWALDDRPGIEVSLERGTGDTSWAPLGLATWKRGTRPDVAGAFGDYPFADRAEWNFFLPCPATPLEVRVVAADSAGQHVVLGTRNVQP